MRTARLLAVSPSMHCSWGVPGPGGCTYPGSVMQPISCLGGVPGPGGVHGPGGGVYLPGGHLPRYSPPCEQNDKQV